MSHANQAGAVQVLGQMICAVRRASFMLTACSFPEVRRGMGRGRGWVRRGVHSSSVQRRLEHTEEDLEEVGMRLGSCFFRGEGRQG